MIRLTRLSQKATLFVLVAMTVVLIVTAHGIRASSAESSRNNTSFLRGANHALLHADFEVSMVRAAGEAASYALTRNPTYLHESAQAVQSAALALDRLRSSLGLSAVNDELVSKCVALLERQHQLLRAVERGIDAARHSLIDAEPGQLQRTLDAIYAYEAQAELLHLEVAAHREAELNNHLTTRPRLHGLVANFFVLAALVLGGHFLLQRAVVTPVDRLSATANAVANGTPGETLAVTSEDEIGRLQTAFNRMVSALQRRHAALEVSERRFRKIAEHFPGAFVVSGVKAKDLLYVNPAFEKVWGRSRESLFKDPTLMIEAVHPADRARVLIALNRLDRGVPGALEFRILDAGGGLRWLWARGVPVKDEHGQLVHVIQTSEDITARKHAETEMSESREQVRRFAATLSSSIERERERLAREMHDELGQVFTGLDLDLAWVGLELGELPPAAAIDRIRTKLGFMSTAIDSATTSVRRISNDLRPPLLDDLGIVAALQIQVEQFEQRSHIGCIAELDDSIELQPELAMMVFRVCQEAMTNVARHAGASRVAIRFAREPQNSVLLEIRDNGRGVDAELASESTSLGLTGMRERARLLGGSFSLSSPRGGGTTVRLRFPQPPQACA